MKDIKNEDLKQKSQEWWSNHSQDYVSGNEIDHLGVPKDLNNDEFLEYLAKNDLNFLKQAYFAQREGEKLFSDIIPIDFLKNKKILEIGCGLGAHTEVLASHSDNVTSIDLSETSIKTTRRRLKLKKLKATVKQADAEELPFSDKEFDFIWSWGVIHHSPDTVKCASEIHRVLKDNGRLGIMLYNKNSLYNWFNVIFRYGVLKGKLLTMNIQELHNRYTDGKALDGAPLSKYYSRYEINNNLFPNMKILKQKSYEQKNAISFFVPSKYKDKFESIIPDSMYTFAFSRLGFLTYTELEKK